MSSIHRATPSPLTDAQYLRFLHAVATSFIAKGTPPPISHRAETETAHRAGPKVILAITPVPGGNMLVA